MIFFSVHYYLKKRNVRFDLLKIKFKEHSDAKFPSMQNAFIPKSFSNKMSFAKLPERSAIRKSEHETQIEKR